MERPACPHDGHETSRILQPILQSGILEELLEISGFYFGVCMRVRVRVRVRMREKNIGYSALTGRSKPRLAKYFSCKISTRHEITVHSSH